MIIHTVMVLYNPLSADKSRRKLLLSEQNGETGHKNNQCNHHTVFAPQAGAEFRYIKQFSLFQLLTRWMSIYYFVWLQSKSKTVIWSKQNKGIYCFTGCMDYNLFSGKHPEVQTRLYLYISYNWDSNSAHHCFITI